MFRHPSSNWKWGTVPVTKLRRRLIASSKTLTLIIAVLIFASLSTMIIHPGTAHADTDCSPNGVALSGSSWLGGGGVNVCNHPGDGSHYCLTVAGAPGDAHCPAGYVWSGDKWQCVELVNRLYLTKGWIKATWYGNGNSLINNLPNGLTKQNNGSISYVNPGDVITLNYGANGHAGIINKIDSNGTIHIVNQNATLNCSVYIDSGSLSTGNAHYHMNAWIGYSVQAIIHAPYSTNPSTPTAVSRDSSDMAVFYNDGNSNLVNWSWNATTGWAKQQWADSGGILGQPAVVSRTTDSIDVFYTTGQHKLIHKGWTSSAGWAYFDVLLSSDVAGDPTVTARDSGDMQIFYRTLEGDIKSIYWSSVTGWNTNPQQLYVGAATTDPYAVSRGSGSMEVFFGKNNGNIVHLGWTPTYGWVTQDWSTNSTSSLPSKPTAVTYNGGGDMATYFQENNGYVGGESWDWQTGWSGQNWAAQLVGNPSAVPGVSNTVDDFYRETGGNIVDRYLSGGSWATTNIVGAGSANGNPYAITRGTANEEVFYWKGTSLMDANWNTTSHSWSASRIN